MEFMFMLEAETAIHSALATSPLGLKEVRSRAKNGVMLTFDEA